MLLNGRAFARLARGPWFESRQNQINIFSAIMYYLYLYSFGKLSLEPVRYTLAKCLYLHYFTTKLDNTILLIAIQLLIFFGVFGDTVYYRDHAENPMHSL